MHKSNFVDFEMRNGTVQLTMNFYRLNQLRTKHKSEYKRYFEIQKAGINTDLDVVDVLYVAYLCANMEQMPNVMSYEEFLMNLRNDRNQIWKTYGDLYTEPKN